MLLLVSVKQVTNFMVAVKEPVVVFETKDGGFLFGNTGVDTYGFRTKSHG